MGAEAREHLLVVAPGQRPAHKGVLCGSFPATWTGAAGWLTLTAQQQRAAAMGRHGGVWQDGTAWRRASSGPQQHTSFHRHMEIEVWSV